MAAYASTDAQDDLGIIIPDMYGDAIEAAIVRLRVYIDKSARQDAVMEAGARLSNTLPYRERPNCFHDACLTERPSCESAYQPCCNYAANLMFIHAMTEARR